MRGQQIVPRNADAGTLPKALLSVLCSGLSPATHQPSPSRRTTRLIDTSPGLPGSAKTPMRPGRRPPRRAQQTWPLRSVGSMEGPITRTRMSQFMTTSSP